MHFDEILRDIMSQLPEKDYIQFIAKLPDDFFQLEDGLRRMILKEIRHRIILNGQKDPEELINIVRQHMGQLINNPINY